MTDTVRIQGPSYSWPSVMSSIASVPFRGFNEINWDEELERAFGYGAGAHYSPRERGRGKYTPKPAKMNVLASAEDTFNGIVEQVCIQQGISPEWIAGAEFPIRLDYYEARLGPITTLMTGCSITKRGQAIKESPEILVIPVEFSVMRYARRVNGKWTTLWDCTETGPLG